MKVAALAAVLALGSAPITAEGPAPQARPTFRSGSAIVALNVTVQDRGSNFVKGLQPADFAVYEDGVKQNVEFFESTRVPVDLILLLDSSSSMGDKLDLVHGAAAGFLRTLRPGDRGAVVSFAAAVRVLQPLSDDQAALEAAVRSTTADGNTSLNNAVYIALKEFGIAAKSAGDVRRQAIVVLSDGADTASLVSFDDVLATARRLGVSIYTVSLQSALEARYAALGGQRRYNADAEYTMKALARETGAQAYFPEPTGLKRVYTSIAAELASQYSIGYVPANTTADGRFRRVNVQVVTRPELRSRTRMGYTADAAAPLPAVHGIGIEPR